MKKIKSHYLHFFNVLISAVLVILGFSACQSTEEYGMPHVSYELKGKVVNQTEVSVSDIQLVIKSVDTSYEAPGDTLYSDAKGEFVYRDDYAWPDSELKVIYRDISDDNVYKTDSVIVNMGEPVGGSGNWYYGKASKEITITLEEKKPDEQ